MKNLAADPSLQEVKRKLRQEMEATLRQEQDPRVMGRGDVFDSYQYVGNRDHSYENWLKFQK